MNNLMGVTNLKEEAEERLRSLKETEQLLEKRLANYPAGKVHIINSQNRVQYYLREKSTDKGGVYLGRDKKRTIQTYLQKSYDEKTSQIIKREIRLLERFVENYHDYTFQIRNIYEQIPEAVKSVIRPVDISDAAYVKNWMGMPYESKAMPEMGTPFVTERGEYVRSKSELSIANTLSRFAIPYKYECPLELHRGMMIHPDFTVLNVKKREVFYWEHRGMMDDRDYAKHSVQRLKDYAGSGIYLGRQLIITEESSTNPLSSREIVDVIRTYLLEEAE